MWDNFYQLDKLFSFQEELLGFLDKRWHESHRFRLVVPQHVERYRALIHFIITKKKKALILTDSKERAEYWQNLIGQFLPDSLVEFEKKRYSSLPNLVDEPSLISVMSYSSMCHPVLPEADKAQARERWLRYLASMDKLEQSLDTVADLDGYTEANKYLDQLALRNISRYLDGLQRFVRPVEDEQEFEKDYWKSAYFEEYAEIFKNNDVEIVICDESHKVIGLWGEMTNVLSFALPKAHMIGVSSTKPTLETLSPRNYFLQQSLFGSAELTVQPPRMVVDGCLAPYRDLLYLSKPTEAEHSYIKKYYDDFQTLVDQLNDSSQMTMTFNDFLRKELEQMERDAPGHWARRNEMVRSCLHCALVNKIQLGGVWQTYIPQLRKTRFVYVLDVLRVFMYQEIYQNGTTQEKRLADNVASSLKAMGYSFTEHHTHRELSLLPDVLKRSANKLKATVDILEHEMSVTGHDLRVMVITDFMEYTAAYSYFPDHDIDYSMGGGLSVYDALQKSVVTTQLNCIAVDNNTLIMNPKFEPFVMKELARWQNIYSNRLRFESKEEGGYARITAIGSAFTEALWSDVLSTLMDKRICFCLIGTRELLTDAWDGLSVNTFVNLSSIESSTAEDKIRRRLLKVKDGEDTIARHSWDVASVLPGVQYGLEDYERLVRKKKDACSLSEDGEFEFSISHIYPLDDGAVNLQDSVIENVNEEMFEWVNRREETLKDWQSKDLSRCRERGIQDLALPDEVEDKVFEFNVVKAGKKVLETGGAIDLYERLFKTIFEAFCQSKGFPVNHEAYRLEFRKRYHACWRMFLAIDASFKEEFLKMLNELTSPCGAMHYVIEFKHSEEGEKRLGGLFGKKSKPEHTTVFNVPSYFSNKELLKTFTIAWQKYLGATVPLPMRMPEIREKYMEMDKGEGSKLKARISTKKVWM